MKGEIISVGSELLLGQIVNSNAQFLSKELANIGVDVYFHTVVGDNKKRLEQAIKVALQRSNLIIFTGGLGPTKDDLTKETIAELFGLKFVLNDQSLRSIEEYFRSTNRPMPENNKKQALVFEGSTVLPNDHGTAPGMVFTEGEHTIMLLPGPPNELNPMFVNYGLKEIVKRLGKEEKIVSRVLRFFGIGESIIEKEIEDIIDTQSNPTIAPLAEHGETSLRITAKHQFEKEALKMIDDMEKKVLARIGQFFYGYDSTSLINELFKKLSSLQFTIAAAESLTGGLFQQELTSIPGASSVIKGGVVCYATEMKEKILQVKIETIQSDGVVSAKCAEELAENVRKMMDASIGISFTGVAGPSEQEGKPVGTVYIGISIKGEEPKSFYHQLSGSRGRIRLLSVKHGAKHLLDQLQTIENEMNKIE